MPVNDTIAAHIVSSAHGMTTIYLLTDQLPCWTGCFNNRSFVSIWNFRCWANLFRLPCTWCCSLFPYPKSPATGKIFLYFSFFFHLKVQPTGHPIKSVVNSAYEDPEIQFSSSGIKRNRFGIGVCSAPWYSSGIDSALVSVLGSGTVMLYVSLKYWQARCKTEPWNPNWWATAVFSATNRIKAYALRFLPGAQKRKLEIWPQRPRYLAAAIARTTWGWPNSLGGGIP